MKQGARLSWGKIGPLLLKALRAVESHHVELNAKAGRPESESETLRIVRDALAEAGL
jgi:hypothetical protein